MDNTNLSNETVLVTGGGGYIGSVLVGILLQQGAKVIVLDRFFFGLDTLKDHIGNENLTVSKKDIRDLTPDDFAGVTSVLDLAAFSNDPAGDLNPSLTWDVNRDGRNNVARAAKKAGVARFVMASTCSIYGAAEDGISDETSPANPLSTYAKSNYAAETALFEMGNSDFTTTSLRNATVFGASPRMRFDLVVNLMTLNAFEKGAIVIMGGGKQWRPLVHVRDVCHGLIALMTAPADVVNGQCYNIGIGNYQVRTIGSIVREIVPFGVTMQIAPDDPDNRNYRVSFDRLKNDIGFEATVTIEDGVREVYNALKFGEIENRPDCSTVKWYKHILDAQKLLASIELNGRLL